MTWSRRCSSSGALVKPTLAVPFFCVRAPGVSVWLLLGVSAIVGHFGMHQRLYDDVLILVPMIALLRMAGAGRVEDGSDVAAGLLFAGTWLTLHAPASLLRGRR